MHKFEASETVFQSLAWIPMSMVKGQDVLYYFQSGELSPNRSLSSRMCECTLGKVTLFFTIAMSKRHETWFLTLFQQLSMCFGQCHYLSLWWPFSFGRPSSRIILVFAVCRHGCGHWFLQPVFKKIPIVYRILIVMVIYTVWIRSGLNKLIFRPIIRSK